MLILDMNFRNVVRVLAILCLSSFCRALGHAPYLSTALHSLIALLSILVFLFLLLYMKSSIIGVYLSVIVLSLDIIIGKFKKVSEFFEFFKNKLKLNREKTKGTIKLHVSTKIGNFKESIK